MSGTPRIDAQDLSSWWEGVAEILVEEARHAPSEADNLRLLLDAARVRGEECNDLEAARRLYEEAQALAPDAVRVLSSLVENAVRREDWVQAREWIERLIAETDDLDDRTLLRLRHAEILALRLGERGDALRTLRTALDESPADVSALLLLAILLDPDDLEGQVELVRRRLVTVDDRAVRLNLLLHLGRLEQLRGGDLAEALSVYTDAYQLDKRSWSAVLGVYRCLAEAADWKALQRFLEDVRVSVSDRPEWPRLELIHETLRNSHFGEASDADALHRLESRLGGDDNAFLELGCLADAAGIALTKEASGSGSFAASRHYQAGLIHEGSRDYEAAADAYDRALKASPDFSLAEHSKRRTSARLGDHGDYVTATDSIAQQTEDTGLRASLYTHLGMVHEFNVGQVAQAAAFYDRAVGAHLSAIGGPPVHEIPALNDLVRALEGTLDVDAYDAALGELIRDCAEPSQVAWLYDRRAELALSKNQDMDRAVEFYGLAVELDPENYHAHRVRQDVLRRRRDWSKLLDSLEAELSEASGARRLHLLSEIAEIHLQLGAPASAEGAWRQALEQDPEWFPAHIGLGQLLDAQGRWRELGEQLAYQLSTLDAGSSQRTSLLGRLAEIYEFRLDLPQKAESAYLELLQLKDAAPDAIAGLERVYSQAGNWAALIEVLEGYAAATDDPESQAVLHIRIGDLLHVHLSDLEGAIGHYRTAIRSAPNLDRAHWGLEWLLAEAGDYQALDTHYDSRLEPHSDDARSVRLHKRLTVTPITESEPIVAELLSIDPGDHLALWARVVGAGTRNDDAATAEALIDLASHIDSRQTRNALLVEAAERLDDDNTDGRIAVWEEIIQGSPENERGWQALLGLYGRGETTAHLRDYLHRLQGTMTQKGSRSTAYWVSAMLSDAMGQPDRALQELRRAYELCPDDVIPLWLMLHRGAYQDVSEQAALMERLAERMVYRSEAAQLFFKAGRLRNEKLHDQHQAVSDFQAALVADPSLQAAADHLEQVLIGQDRLDEIQELSLMRAQAATDPDLKASLLLRCARAERRLKDNPEEAVVLLQQLLVAVPGHEAGLRELAETLVSIGRGSDAVTHYEVLIEHADDESALGNAYLELGRLKMAMGNHSEEAVELYRRAVSVTANADALIGLGDAYYGTGDYDLAQLTFRRLERMDVGPAEALIAVLGQAEALLAADRPAEAQRRVSRLERTVPPGQAAIERAARILVAHPSLPEALHQILSGVVTSRGKGDVEAPEHTYVTAPTSLEAQPSTPSVAPSNGEPSLFDPSHSEATSITGYGINIAGEGAEPKSINAAHSTGELERLTSTETWTGLADAYPRCGDWYREVGRWIEGTHPAAALGAVYGPVPLEVRMGACPEDLPPVAITLLGHIVRLCDGPLVMPQERAEIAAEGQQATTSDALYVRMRSYASNMGLDTVVMVRSAARPYTLDLFRKSPPVITFGSSLLDGLDVDRGSFLIGSTVVPIVEGLLPPRYTAAGRALDDDRFEAFYAAVLSNLGCTHLCGDSAQPYFDEYNTLVGEALIGVDKAAFSALAAATQAACIEIPPHRLRGALDRYTIRLAAVMADSLGGALDAIRQLDFDDRPRDAMTGNHVRSLVRDNEIIRDLLQFAQTDACREIRRHLRPA